MNTKFLTILSLSVLIPCTASAQFVQGGNNGNKTYLCKVQSTGKLAPGIADSTDGSGFRSFQSLIAKVKKNIKISSAKRTKRIAALKTLKQEVLAICRGAPIPLATPTPQPHQLVTGVWLGSFTCEESVGVDCEFSIKLTFNSDGTYAVALRGAALYCKYSLTASSSVVPFSVDALGSYTYAPDGTLEIRQLSSSASWKTCPIIGSFLTSRTSTETEPAVIYHRTTLSSNGTVLSLEDGTGDSIVGLPLSTSGLVNWADEEPQQYIRQ